MSIRTIAVFHCTASVLSAWSLSNGVVTTLARMGYDVIDCGNPAGTTLPIEAFSHADLIILSSVEWYAEILIARYGPAWRRLPMPKIAWFVESAERDDRNFDFAACLPLADRHYFPAIQDAERFGGEWLPFAPDIAIFHPRPVEKRYNAAFLGALYPKRVAYVQRITHPINYISSVSDDDQARSAALLADAYCSTRIFVNFPAYSRLMVLKIAEVMACGVMVITPAIDHPDGLRNMAQFQDRTHLIYYHPGRPQDLGPLIEHYLADEAARQTIIQAGLREIRQHHTLEGRLAQMIADIRFDRRLIPEPAAPARFHVLTHHNTVLYLDPDSGAIRHAPVGWEHNTLLLECAGSQARLRTRDGTQVGAADYTAEPNPNGRVGLRADATYLSAEPDGTTRADIPWLREWEQFRLVPIEVLPSR